MCISPGDWRWLLPSAIVFGPPLLLHRPRDGRVLSGLRFAGDGRR
jgi:hypothetical protein